MKKILIADSLNPDVIDAMKSIGDFDVTVKTGMDEKSLVAAIAPFNALVVRNATKVTRKVLEAAQNLQIIVRAGIGLDNIDLDSACELGVTVSNTPRATSISVAEQTMGLMLSTARNLGQANLSMKAHKWEKEKLGGIELFEKVLGIIGIGRIGQEVARRAFAFGMKVIACDVRQITFDPGVQFVPLEYLLSVSDIITLHLPFTPETRRMISHEQFAMMKDGVMLINASRGGIVDEKALLAALESGKVRAAALDVFEKEPPEDFSLIDHPKVIATPHIGAAAKEGQKRAGMEVVRILAEVLLSPIPDPLTL